MASESDFAEQVKRATVATGEALARAAKWLGGKAKDGFESVDPDVWKHVAELPLMGLTMLAGGATKVEALPDDGFPPVVFVHGLGGNAGQFLPMRLFFRAMKRTRTWAVELPPNCTVEVLSGVLADTLTAVADANGCTELDVVAHSLGGLVARATLLELERRGSPVRVRSLVTLGTPHTGSHLARYANTTTTNDLRPGSPVLQRLEAQLPWRGPPAQPRLVAFWSRADIIILPAEMSLVEGAENVELEGLSHNGLLLSPVAWEAAFSALQRGVVPRGPHLAPPR